MADASELYMANGILLDDPRLHGAPMIVALSGYADAGHLAEQVRETLLGGLPSEVLARFDSDQLHDYRARRPHVRFVQDHFERIEGPELALHLVTDPLGQHFTVLSGPEPDLHWERFLDAVMDLVQRMETSIVTDVTGFPMPVPHTRPFLVTPHGSRTDLVGSGFTKLPIIEMSSSVAQQLEIRLAEAGIDHVGFSVHVPQYMAEAVLPQIAVTAFEHFSAATALTLPTDALRDDSRDALQRIEEQVAESPEIQAVISQLEQRYDEAVEGAQPRSLLAGDADELPDADEIGAAAEAFLAQRSESDDL